MLVDKLEAHLVALDALIKSHEAKVKRLERQEKYALSNGINPENIIAAELTETKRVSVRSLHLWPCQGRSLL